MINALFILHLEGVSEGRKQFTSLRKVRKTTTKLSCAAFETVLS